MRHDRGVAMRRVAIIGSSGAGKSTLARRLGERTGLPVVHLDEHFWHPGWVETPRSEWRAAQVALCAQDAWIMDGNYSGTLDVRLARADTVVLLDLPRRVTIPGVVGRWVRHHGEPVQAAGCPERPTRELLRFVWDYPTGGRVRALAALDAHGRDDLALVILRSRAEIRRWLDDLAPLADATPH